jgi:ribosomal protein S13
VSFLSLNVYQNALRLILMKEHRLVNFLKQTTHIKGRKYIFKLPVRGQRTHTNSRTVKNVILG